MKLLIFDWIFFAVCCEFAVCCMQNVLGIKLFGIDFIQNAVGKSIIVSLDKEPRMLEYGVEVLPRQVFLERLWAGELGV